MPIDITLEDAKTIGILGGLLTSTVALLLNFYSTLRSIRSQKITNFQEITKSHREIWKMTIEKPDLYARIFQLDVDMINQPVTYTESLFMRLVFLHMSSAFCFSKHSHMLQIEKLELDFSEILTFPIPRVVWGLNRKYYNGDFINFFETAGRKQRIMSKLLGNNIFPPIHRPWSILLLSAYSEQVAPIIKALGDDVICLTDKDPAICVEFIKKNGIDFIVSYGYGKIIKKDVLGKVPAINVHTSYLPLNRGPNPNLWGWLENTRKGVTIHFMDEGIDTGDIIAQREIKFEGEVTLQSSYERHVAEGLSLFKEQWPQIRSGNINRSKQAGFATSHTFKSQEPLKVMFEDGSLDLPIEEFCKRAKKLLEDSKNKQAVHARCPVKGEGEAMQRP